MKKILVIRFSSIGDIVLTSPIVRCIKSQLPDAEVHFLTKASFESLVSSNPFIDKVHLLKDSLNDLKESLISENFDFVVDLHKNIRSKKVCSWLDCPNGSFDKLNWKKFMLTKLKVDKMPNIHIVDRYFQAVQSLNVVNDQKGLDFFYPDNTIVEDLPEKYHCFAIGGSFGTKKYPKELIKQVIDKSPLPVVIIGGGKEDQEVAEYLGDSCINLVNKINIQESAYVVSKAEKVITHDTGMMHIAAALKKDIISIWGNTVPSFGMTPYLPGENSKIFENNDLSCRPCSKLGYDECPKKHFKCMVGIDPKVVSSCL